MEVSKDGKVTTITSKGVDSTGYVAVYDKQWMKNIGAVGCMNSFDSRRARNIE